MDFASNLLSTRRGTIILGAVAAGLAALLLLVYLSQYRSNLESSTTPTPVLVARSLIPKGTPGDVVAQTRRIEVASIPEGKLKEGALVDPASLKGRAATADIYPGQQLTAADFTAAAVDVPHNRLSGVQRGVAISVDKTHGAAGEIRPGDRVDVWVGFNADSGGVTQPIIKLLLQNILVMRVPDSEDGKGQFLLRARAQDAAKIAFAQDNGTLWLMLRPPANAKPISPNSAATVQSVLFNRPVAVGR